jgi:glycosyltransferase involved in cell wall biosynthesis
MTDSKLLQYLQNCEEKPYDRIQSYIIPSKKNKLNVAMFTNNYLPSIGGVSLSIDRMASVLRKQGHRVFIFAPKYPNSDFEDHEDVIRCKQLKYLEENSFDYAISDIFSSYIEEVFTKLDIDIIHVHHPYWMGKKGMKIANKYKIPIVYTYHTRLDKYLESIPHISLKVRQQLSQYIIENFASNCSYIFAPSESARECLRQLNIRKPIEILPTGVDLSEYNVKHHTIEEVRKKFLKDSDILLFSAARLSKEKNLFFLLEGLKYIKQHTSIKFKCIIAGDGPEKRNMENYIIENDLMNEVVLLGTIPPKEINKYYMASDIFVFSSTSETQGIVLLEAMAASLPVVAVSSCGVDDMIQNGINGFKTYGDIREWGTKVIHLMENPLSLKKMSLNACKIARNYTIEDMGQKAVAVYEQLIKNKLN